MKRILFVLLMAAPLLLLAQRDLSQAKVSTTEEAEGIYRMFVADAVSVVVFSGPDGLLVIDAAYEQTTSQLMEAIREVSDAPIRYLVNTHIHGDHTGGNAVIGRDAEIVSHTSVKEYLGTERKQGERVIPAMPENALPNITFTDRMDLAFNGQEISMIHLPEGHTGGDIIIYFPESNLLVLGDLLFAGYFPYVDVGNGGNPLGFIKNVEWIINNYKDDVKLIGGHGPVFTMQQLADWNNNLQQTIEVVRQAKANGMTLEQMKSERILQKWEEFGSFFITEDRWLDTVYPAV